MPNNFCPSCGAQNAAGSKFCMNCGAKLSVTPPTCPGCGKIVPEGATFCPECGTRIGAAPQNETQPRTQGPAQPVQSEGQMPQPSPAPVRQKERVTNEHAANPQPVKQPQPPRQGAPNSPQRARQAPQQQQAPAHTAQPKPAAQPAQTRAAAPATAGPQEEYVDANEFFANQFAGAHAPQPQPAPVRQDKPPVARQEAEVEPWGAPPPPLIHPDTQPVVSDPREAYDIPNEEPEDDWQDDGQNFNPPPTTSWDEQPTPPYQQQSNVPPQYQPQQGVYGQQPPQPRPQPAYQGNGYPQQPPAPQYDGYEDEDVDPLTYLAAQERARPSSTGLRRTTPAEEPSDNRKGRKHKAKKEQHRLFNQRANYDGYYDDRRPIDDDLDVDGGRKVQWVPLILGLIGVAVFAFVAIQLKSIIG